MNLCRSALALGLLIATTAALPACSILTKEDTAQTDAQLTAQQGVVRGATTGSRFAQRDREYVAVRSIDALQKLGALSGPLLDLAKRIDGSAVAGPPDGLLTVEELARMEYADAWSTLFPEEQALVPQLWDFFLLSTEEPIRVLASQVFDITSLVSEDFAPAAIDPNASVAISDLSEPLRAVARRIELSSDSDGRPDTVSMADVDAAQASPGSFVAAERALFGDIRKAARAHAITVLGTGSYVVDAPGAPYGYTLPAGNVGNDVTIEYSEQYEVSENQIADATDVYAMWIEATQTYNVSTRVGGTGLTLQVVDLEHVDERTGNDLKDGQLSVEVWSNGHRIADRRVFVERAVRTKIVPGHADVVSQGTPLYRNASPTNPLLRAIFERQAGSPGFPRRIPTVTLQPGVYDFWPAAVERPMLEVYPGGVLFVRDASGARLRLAERGGGQFHGNGQVAGGCSGGYTFTAATSTIDVCSTRMPVDDSMLR
jgi:hypothetical protein